MAKKSKKEGGLFYETQKQLADELAPVWTGARLNVCETDSMERKAVSATINVSFSYRGEINSGFFDELEQIRDRINDLCEVDEFTVALPNNTININTY